MDQLNITHLSFLLAALGLICSLFSGIIALFSLVKILAMERSTHRVQLMPVDSEVDAYNQEILSRVNEPTIDDPWSTTDESIAEQEKMYKEELKDKMPEFYDEKPNRISY